MVRRKTVRFAALAAVVLLLGAAFLVADAQRPAGCSDSVARAVRFTAAGRSDNALIADVELELDEPAGLVVQRDKPLACHRVVVERDNPDVRLIEPAAGDETRRHPERAIDEVADHGPYFGGVGRDDDLFLH